MNHSLRQQKRASSSSGQLDKIKDIDALYRQQIREIYADSKAKVEQQSGWSRQHPVQKELHRAPISSNKHLWPQVEKPTPTKSATTLHAVDSNHSSRVEQEKTPQSALFLRTQAVPKTLEALRKETESKELRVRELSSRCEMLTDKLSDYLSPSEIHALDQSTDLNSPRMNRLLKIRGEEVLFKMKSQIASVLLEIGDSEQGLNQLESLGNEAALLSFMGHRIKGFVRRFKDSESEWNLEAGRYRLEQERLHEESNFLRESTEMLRVNEGKYKQQAERLKVQLQESLEKIKAQEELLEDSDTALFRCRKQAEELQINNSRLSLALKAAQNEHAEALQLWETERQGLKNAYNAAVLQRKKLEEEAQARESLNDELVLRQSFLQQENDQLNRELVKQKERYEWLGRDKEAAEKDLNGQLEALTDEFAQYKAEYNKSAMLRLSEEIDQLVAKVEDYQRDYEAAMLDYEEEKGLVAQLQFESNQKVRETQLEWRSKLEETEQRYRAAIDELRDEATVEKARHTKHEEMISEEMEARVKSIFVEQQHQIESIEEEKESLERELREATELLKVRESLIVALQSQNGQL